jgi:hypothetical protein
MSKFHSEMEGSERLISSGDVTAQRDRVKGGFGRVYTHLYLGLRYRLSQKQSGRRAHAQGGRRELPGLEKQCARLGNISRHVALASPQYIYLGGRFLGARCHRSLSSSLPYVCVRTCSK